MSNWAAVATPRAVYVGLEDRAEFDKIALPATEHAPREDGERCVSKAVKDPASGVMVIFQHWVTKGE